MYCRITSSISKEELDFANKILSSCLDILGETTFLTKNFRFAGGIEISITVYAGEENSCVDAMLFNCGQEAMALMPRFDLLGKYSFSYNNDIYEVVLELE